MSRLNRSPVVVSSSHRFYLCGARKYFILILFIPVLLAGMAIAQQASTSAQPSPPAVSPDFKSAHLVSIVTIVRDKHGKIVDNLAQDDFVLDEDGHAQAIRAFSRGVDLPLTLGLLIDTDFSQRWMLDQEHLSSSHFIDQVLREDKDKGFLIHFYREVELLQDLTASKQKLDDGLDKLQQPQFEASNDDSSSGGYPDSDSGYPGSGRQGSGRSSRLGAGATLYDSIYLAANELMRKQQGRKVMIVFSDGIDRSSKVTLDRAIEAAQRADTVVYSILIPYQRGENNGRGWGQGGGLPGMGGPWGGRHGGYPRNPQPAEANSDAKKVLERISNETGGRMLEVSKKEPIDQIYQKIQEDLHNQYIFGYTPDRSANAPQYRKIHLATKKKDFVVQTRAGYYPAVQPDSNVTQTDRKSPSPDAN